MQESIFLVWIIVFAIAVIPGALTGGLVAIIVPSLAGAVIATGALSVIVSLFLVEKFSVVVPRFFNMLVLLPPIALSGYLGVWMRYAFKRPSHLDHPPAK